MIILNPRFTWLAIAVIVLFGIPSLIYGIYLMINADPPPISYEDLKEVNLIEPKTVILTPTYDSEKTAHVKEIAIDFDTIIVFQDDVIKISAKAIDVNPNVMAIYLFVTDPTQNMTSLSGDNLAREINYGIKNKNVLQLFETVEPKFQDSQLVPFYQANQQVTIKGIVVLKDTIHGDIDSDNQPRHVPAYMELDRHVFTVFPKTVKLEAQTNHAVIQSAKETRKANWEQDRSNNLIQGLTWIGISAIPILVGADILLRIYLGERTIRDSSDDELDQPKKPCKDHSKFYS